MKKSFIALFIGLIILIIGARFAIVTSEKAYYLIAFSGFIITLGAFKMQDKGL